MSENITLAPVSSFTNDGSAVATVNANSTIIATAFTDCLSLSGGQPNAMQSNLDMNSNQIINLPAPSSLSSPLRLVDISGVNGPAGPQGPVGAGGLPGISILDHGGNAGGAVDNVSAMNAVLALLVSAGGGTIVFPVGTYLFSSTVNWPQTGSNITVQGAGAGTIFNVAGSVGSLFSVNYAGTSVHNVIIKDCVFNVTGGSLPSGNNAIFYLVNCVNWRFERCKFTGAINYGILWSAGVVASTGYLGAGGGAFLFIKDCIFYSTFAYAGGTPASGIVIGLGDNFTLLQQLQVAEVFITDTVMSGMGNGLTIINAGGVYCTNVSVYNSKVHGLITFPTGVGQNVKACSFNNFIADTCGSDGISINTGGSSITTLCRFNNCWSATNVGNGVFINTACADGISFINCEFTNNGLDGIVVNACTDIQIIGCRTFCNSTLGSGARNGINIQSTCEHCIVTNNVSGQGTTSNSSGLGTNLQGYGILIGVAASDYLVVNSNVTKSNVTGSFFNGSTGINNYIPANSTVGT